MKHEIAIAKKRKLVSTYENARCKLVSFGERIYSDSSYENLPLRADIFLWSFYEYFKKMEMEDTPEKIREEDLVVLLQHNRILFHWGHAPEIMIYRKKVRIVWEDKWGQVWNRYTRKIYKSEGSFHSEIWRKYEGLLEDGFQSIMID